MELVVHQRGASAIRSPLGEGETSVGRASENEVVLAAAKVSGEHLVLTRRGAALTVEDLDSTNGTFLNGRRIDGEAEVFEGDRIYLGDYVAWVEGGVRARSEGARLAFEDRGDELLMVSSPPPAVAGAPDAFAKFDDRFVLQFSRLVREGLRLGAARGKIVSEEELRASVLPAKVGAQGGETSELDRCVSAALDAIRFVSSFKLDALPEQWASVSMREGAFPLVLGADGARVSWREARAVANVPLTRELVDVLIRRFASSVGLLDEYDGAGVVEAFDAGGGYGRGSCDLTGHHGATFDLRRSRRGGGLGVSSDSWSAIVNDLVVPTRQALASGGRVLWCLRGPVPGWEAIQDLLGGVSESSQVVCVSDSGALGRGNSAVTSFARARISGGDDGLSERVRAQFAAGCELFVSHLWRPGTVEAEAIKEALLGGCGAVLVTVWANSVEEGARLLAGSVGADLVPSKFDFASHIRVHMNKAVEIDSVRDPAFVDERGERG